MAPMITVSETMVGMTHHYDGAWKMGVPKHLKTIRDVSTHYTWFNRCPIKLLVATHSQIRLHHIASIGKVVHTHLGKEPNKEKMDAHRELPQLTVCLFVVVLHPSNI